MDKEKHTLKNVFIGLKNGDIFSVPLTYLS